MEQTSRRLGRRLRVRFRASGGHDFHVGYTTNISQTGMFVATIRPLKPGTEIDVEVSDKKHPVQLHAVVIHARKVPAMWQRIRPSGMGIRFLAPTEHAQSLRQLVGRAASAW